MYAFYLGRTKQCSNVVHYDAFEKQQTGGQLFNTKTMLTDQAETGVLRALAEMDLLTFEQ